MQAFDENLCMFLKSCQNDALESLKSNRRYNERKKIQNERRAKLEAAITTEAISLLEEYDEAVISVYAMEDNMALIRGFTLQSELHKRFDMSAPECQSFTEEYL
jgi:hypothetical protein